jgi:serine/threonine protein kinase
LAFVQAGNCVLEWHLFGIAQSVKAGIVASTKKASRYHRDRAIAENAYAVLYVGRDVKTQQPVLIREFKPGILKEDDQWAGFREQLNLRRQTQVPGMLAVAGVGGSLTEPYLVVTGTTGQSLRNAISAAELPGLPGLLSKLRPVAQALDELHQLGFVHGDVRPETLFFDAQGNFALNELTSHYALCGWDHQSHVMSPQFLGAVFPKTYLAQEVSSGGPLSRATDQYALGLVLLELCAGVLPRETAVATDLISGQGVDRSRQRNLSQLRPVLSRALSPEPNRRYQSCQEMLAHAELFISQSSPGKWVILGLGTAAVLVASALIFQRAFSSNPRAQEDSRKQTARETISQQYQEPIPIIPGFPPQQLTPPTETTAAAPLLEEVRSTIADRKLKTEN